MTRTGSTLLLLFLLLAAGGRLSAQSATAPRPADGVISSNEALAFLQGLAQRGLYEECLAQADSFLERYPGHAQEESVAAWRIQALFGLKRHAETANAIRDYLTRYPKATARSEMQWCLAECLDSAGDYKNALPVYEELLKTAKGPRAEETRYRLALCLVNLDRKDDARKYLEELAEKTPDAEHLARIYAVQYLAILAQNDGDAPKALERLLPLIQIADLPKELRQNLLLTAAYLAFTPPVKDYAKAAELYGVFVAECPDDPRTTEIRRTLLTCHYALDHHRDFLELLERYCRERPEAAKDAELNWLKANALFKVGKNDEAMKLFQAISEDDLQPQARRQRALLLAILCAEGNDLEKVVELGKRYYEQYPTAADALSTLFLAASAEATLGRLPDALADLEMLYPIVSAGADPKLQQNVGIALAQLLAKSKQTAKATDLYLELAERSSDDSPTSAGSRQVLLGQALVLMALEDPRAMETATKLRDLAKDDAQRLACETFRYKIAFRNKQYDLAREIIGIILAQVTPAHTPIWLYRRAETWRRQGKYAETADDCLTVLRHPECPKDLRAKILPETVTLLYYLKRAADATGLLDGLFAQEPQPELSTALLQTIAEERLQNGDGKRAENALQMLLRKQDLSESMKDRARTRLAEACFQQGAAKRAEELLAALAEERGSRQLPLPPDADALRAEVALALGSPQNALIYAKQALDATEKPYWQECIPRARWALAQALLDQNANDEAFTAATRGFILSKHATYTPRCYQVAILAKERLGDTKTANELRKALQEENGQNR